MKEGELKTGKKETVVVTTPLKKVTLANTKDEVNICGFFYVGSDKIFVSELKEALAVNKLFFW